MGRQLRQLCPRRSLAEWKPSWRLRDAVELLIESSRGRLKNLIPLRYGRMMANPFAFYRGAAAIMAHDLSFTPATGLHLQVCGDCHLLNFGGFGTPERRIIFDINDFDETAVGAWEWDMKRLATSFVIASRSNGFNPVDCREAAWLCARSYRETLSQVATDDVLNAWYSAEDMERMAASKDLTRGYRKKVKSARTQSSHAKEFAKLAVVQGPHVKIREVPPLIFHTRGTSRRVLHDAAIQATADYTRSLPIERRVLIDRYKLVDEAYKVVGVGSVGLFCGVALFMSGNGDPLFLQFKEAQSSVLEPYAGRSPFLHHGQRVVVGQRIMQAASDIFLGWMSDTSRPPRHFYMRQLRDAKIKPLVDRLKPSSMKTYAALCGHTLAQAHSRSGDSAVISGYIGKSTSFEDALTEFAVAYADENEQDYDAFQAARRTRRITARSVE